MERPSPGKAALFTMLIIALVLVLAVIALLIVHIVPTIY